MAPGALSSLHTAALPPMVLASLSGPVGWSVPCSACTLSGSSWAGTGKRSRREKDVIWGYTVRRPCHVGWATCAPWAGHRGQGAVMSWLAYSGPCWHHRAQSRASLWKWGRLRKGGGWEQTHTPLPTEDESHSPRPLIQASWPPHITHWEEVLAPIEDHDPMSLGPRGDWELVGYYHDPSHTMRLEPTQEGLRGQRVKTPTIRTSSFCRFSACIYFIQSSRESHDVRSVMTARWQMRNPEHRLAHCGPRPQLVSGRDGTWNLVNQTLRPALLPPSLHPTPTPPSFLSLSLYPSNKDMQSSYRGPATAQV